MAIHSDDFQSLYRRYAYSLYREVFEELRDIDATREILYRIFSRIREEGMEDGFNVEERIYAYKLEYVKAHKKAKLDVDRIWYQMKNDEILGREPRPIEAGQPEVTEPVVEAEEITPEPEVVPEATTPMSLSEPSMDELLADMEKRERRPRRIREVFPEEEEEVVTEEPKVVPEAEEPIKSGKAGIWILWVLLVIAVVIFLWILANLLMAQGILPFVDLGYAWFNENVTVLFPIVAELAG